MCRSNDIIQLSLDERIEIIRFLKDKTAGCIPLVASGHVSDSYRKHIKEIKTIAATGVEAVVIITNIVAQKRDSNETWITNVELILERPPHDIQVV